MKNDYKQYLIVVGDKVTLSSNTPQKIKMQFEKTYGVDCDIYMLIDQILIENEREAKDF